MAGDDLHPHVTEGIRSLHDRLDEIERLVTEGMDAAGVHAGTPGHGHDGPRRQPALPAWRRPTAGEARWQAAVCTAAAIALQVAVPGRLVLVSPSWILPVVQGALLIALVTANPHRINRASRRMRGLSLMLAALISFANAWSVARLVVVLVQGGAAGSNPTSLLITGGAIWLTNVVAFALWYWEFDRGGPVARAQAVKRYPDFQFVQMVSPEMAPPDWEPAFFDYLYLAFTNAAAFSPTDVMPLSRWAKLLMTVQSAVSIVTVALVVSRAVNILK
ncbi:MAG TPA: hypothetical protein VG142_13150 [Trebonia sp.]|jgi:uncharacterized membrane protein|nr:hypothetical protein [Trebonia sp.]